MRVSKVVGRGFLAIVAACMLPSIAAATVSLSVGSASGRAGETVKVRVSLVITAGESVGSFSNQVNYQPSTPIAVGTGSNPACNNLVEVTLDSYRFRPQGCSGATCTGALAAILGPETGLAQGEIYECDIAIAGDAAAGDYELTVSDAAYSDPLGMEFDITGTPGTISVVVDPTATATHTHTPTQAVTATPTRTNTPVPTNTRTVTPTFPPSGVDDGCQMGSGDSSNSLLLLLLPVAAMMVFRRRAN